MTLDENRLQFVISQVRECASDLLEVRLKDLSLKQWHNFLEVVTTTYDYKFGPRRVVNDEEIYKRMLDNYEDMHTYGRFRMTLDRFRDRSFPTFPELREFCQIHPGDMPRFRKVFWNMVEEKTIEFIGHRYIKLNRTEGN